MRKQICIIGGGSVGLQQAYNVLVVGGCHVFIFDKQPLPDSSIDGVAYDLAYRWHRNNANYQPPGTAYFKQKQQEYKDLIHLVDHIPYEMDLYFICIPTPTGGMADTFGGFIEDRFIEQLGDLRDKLSDAIVVNCTTVPVGFTEKLHKYLYPKTPANHPLIYYPERLNTSHTREVNYTRQRYAGLPKLTREARALALKVLDYLSSNNLNRKIHCFDLRAVELIKISENIERLAQLVCHQNMLIMADESGVDIQSLLSLHAHVNSKVIKDNLKPSIGIASQCLSDATKLSISPSQLTHQLPGALIRQTESMIAYRVRKFKEVYFSKYQDLETAALPKIYLFGFTFKPNASSVDHHSAARKFACDLSREFFRRRTGRVIEEVSLQPLIYIVEPNVPDIQAQFKVYKFVSLDDAIAEVQSGALAILLVDHDCFKNKGIEFDGIYAGLAYSPFS